MSGHHDEPDDATPLSAEERAGLIPSHVTLRRELNELEQQNILQADAWAFMRKRDPIDEAFGRNLHRRMFGKVWRWTGRYRETNKKILASIARSSSRISFRRSTMQDIGQSTIAISLTNWLYAFIMLSFSFTPFRTGTAAGHD